MSLFELIGVTLLSMIIFNILFIGLSKSMIGLFTPIQKRTRVLKRKRFWQYTSLILLLILNQILHDVVHYNTWVWGATIGFIIALNNVMFEAIGEVK